MNLRRLILVALALVPVTAFAGTPVKERALSLWDRLNAPKPYLDSAYVFQPKSSWDVSVSYKGYWNGINFQIPIHYAPVASPQTTMDVTMSLILADHTTHNIGLYGGYGPINIGYSFSLGKDPGQRDRKFFLDWLSPHFGAQFYYASFGQKTMNVRFDRTDADVDMAYPSNIGIWRLEGYYAFNKNHFSYQAAYKGKMIQRKSAGSVVASAKYQHTDVFLSRDSGFVGLFLLNNGGYSIDQISLGVGYSFNWVPYHKNGTGASYKGLRNLTLNLTALPQFTFLNEMLMTRYNADGPDEHLRVHGRMNPDLLGKVGICYTIGHVYIAARFEYYFNMVTSGEMLSPDQDYRISVNGNLSSWLGGFDIHYRF